MLAVDDSQMRRQLDQFQRMFSNAQKQLQSAFSPQARQQAQQIGAQMGAANNQAQEVKKQMGLFERMREGIGNISKNSLALVGIGAGIAGIFKLMMDSSPILQSTFKLLQHSVMMFLRPVADFIGLMFRPIMVEFYRKLIIPYYQHVHPFMQALGKNVGQKIADFFNDPVAGLKGLADAGVFGPIGIGVSKLADWVSGGGWEAFKLEVETNWNNVRGFFDKIGADISGAVQGAWNKVTGFFSDVGQAIGSTLLGAWSKTKQFFSDMGEAISSTIVDAWNRFTLFFSVLKGAIDVNLIAAWDSVQSFFNGAKQAVNAVIQPAWDSIQSFFSDAKQAINTVIQSSWESIKGLGGSIASILEDIWRKLKEIWDKIVGNPLATDPIGDLGKWLFGGEQKKVDLQEQLKIDDKIAYEKALAETRAQGFRGGTAEYLARVRSGGSSSSGSKSSPNISYLSGLFSGSTKRAQGGLIPEHMIGFGVNSGRIYQVGEKGPERVTPIGRGGSQPIIVEGPLMNVENLHAGNNAEVQRMLNQMEARIRRLSQTFQENKSRAGII